MTAPDSPPPGSSLLDELADTLQLGKRWGQTLMDGLLLLAVSMVVGFFLSPGLYSQQIPELSAEHVGKPFRAASPAGFKAGRDFEIIHSAMTEQRRREARAAVRPVYDLDPTVVSEVREAVKRAFTAMRGRLGGEEQTASPASEAAEVRRPRLAPGGSAQERERRDLELLQADFRELLFGRKEAPLDAEVFQALYAPRFSEALEKAVLELLEHAYGQPEHTFTYVASSREEFARAGARGIVVRDLRGGERRLEGTAPEVQDVREVHARLEASLASNLLPEAPAEQRRAALRLAQRLVRPSLTINLAETEARRGRAAAAVKDAAISIKKGQRIIDDGERVTEMHRVVLQGMRAQTGRLDLLRLQVAGTGVAALLLAASYLFCRTAFRRFRPSRKDLALLGVLLVGELGLLQLWMSVSEAVQDRYDTALPLEAFSYAFPLAAGAMLVRFLIGQELSLVFAVVLACLAGIMLGNSLSYGVYALAGGLVAADRIGRARDRSGIFRAGLATGALNLVTALFLLLVEGKELGGDTLVIAAFACAGTTLAVPLAVVALTPLIEAAFGYASDLKLLELANLNHPALKELIIQAPGTYHHSIILGTLVESAAEAIGANPLLARTCAYYHDIGKCRNPLYFGENQRGENKHESLAPAMSAVILKRHVIEGLELARQYRLPRRVTDAIAQHHGTRVVAYFYQKALKELEGWESAPPVDESIFRYSGPKPQSREVALVMLADAVEASCSMLPELTAARLQAQVHKVIHNIFSEGQLDECELTSKDLHLVAQSFVRTLEGLYPTRRVEAPTALAAVRPEGRVRSAGS